MGEQFPDPAEHMRRPELDRNHPARLFTYARDTQQWLREHVSEYQMPDAIDHLANKLEQYLSSTFDTMPEVSVTSGDVRYTRSIEGGGSRHVIESSSLPLADDAKILGEHQLKGVLFGFHRGDDTDIRAYLSVGEGVRHFMGGIYTPLLSVGIETSDIQLVEASLDEQFHQLHDTIKSQLIDYPPQVNRLVETLIEQLVKTDTSATRRLHDSARIVAEIARDTILSQQFIDTLMEIISLKLRFDEPQDIQASLHREVITQRPVASYKAKPGPTHFSAIEHIQLGLIGETSNKGLGLFFLNDDKAVQVPVQYITNIYKSIGD